MDQISTDQLHAFIRTAFVIQATLTSIGITAYLFIIPRWRRRLRYVIRQPPPEDIREEEERVRAIYNLLGQEKPVWFILLLPPIALVAEGYCYVHRLIQDEILIYIIGAAFLFMAWLILRPLHYRELI